MAAMKQKSQQLPLTKHDGNVCIPLLEIDRDLAIKMSLYQKNLLTRSPEVLVKCVNVLETMEV